MRDEIDRRVTDEIVAVREATHTPKHGSFEFHFKGRPTNFSFMKAGRLEPVVLKIENGDIRLTIMLSDAQFFSLEGACNDVINEDFTEGFIGSSFGDR